MLPSRAHVVKHGQEILQHALDAHLANKIAITVDAPLVVDVLGLQPLQSQRYAPPASLGVLSLPPQDLERGWSSSAAPEGRSRSCRGSRTS